MFSLDSRLVLGIETLGGVFTRLITRNTTIPCRKSQIFSTPQMGKPPSRSMSSRRARDGGQNRTLAASTSSHSAGPARRASGRVTFDIDANGIVHVSAKDLGTGKEQKIRIEASSG